MVRVAHPMEVRVAVPVAVLVVDVEEIEFAKGEIQFLNRTINISKPRRFLKPSGFKSNLQICNPETFHNKLAHSQSSKKKPTMFSPKKHDGKRALDVFFNLNIYCI